MQGRVEIMPSQISLVSGHIESYVYTESNFNLTRSSLDNASIFLSCQKDSQFKPFLIIGSSEFIEIFLF